MAAKRDHAVVENENGISDKRLKSDSSENDGSIEKFVSWCKEMGVNFNEKVYISREHSCAQYGLIASADIKQGELLFEIPRSSLLMPQTSSIADLLLRESGSLKSKSGWIPLILTLLHEYTASQSKWHGYIHFVPNFEELYLPMFWKPGIVDKELLGTGVPDAVLRDLENLTDEFNKIALPFMQKHSDIFSPMCLDLEMYKKMVAFILAYSFTEPLPDEDDSDEDDIGNVSEVIKSPPMMVPVADILNHIAKNNAHLDFGRESLKMVAVEAITKGEEIYNTYGQLANYHLLHMYGFAEPYPNNHFDTVEIPISVVQTVAEKTLKSDDDSLMKEKWEFLRKYGVISDDGAFVVGRDGILTEDEMFQTLKVLVMNRTEFAHHKEKEGWSDDEVSDEEASLSNDDIQSLPKHWKQIIKSSCEACITRYPTTLVEDENKLNSDSWSNLLPWQQYCVHVRYGQLKLLHGVVQLCD